MRLQSNGNGDVYATVTNKQTNIRHVVSLLRSLRSLHLGKLTFATRYPYFVHFIRASHSVPSRPWSHVSMVDHLGSVITAVRVKGGEPTLLTHIGSAGGNKEIHNTLGTQKP